MSEYFNIIHSIKETYGTGGLASLSANCNIILQNNMNHLFYKNGELVNVEAVNYISRNYIADMMIDVMKMKYKTIPQINPIFKYIMGTIDPQIFRSYVLMYVDCRIIRTYYFLRTQKKWQKYFTTLANCGIPDFKNLKYHYYDEEGPEFMLQDNLDK